MAIDGKGRQNMARYINHSCSPNCEPEEDEEQRIFIVARRNIKAGEQFGYDYGRNIGTSIYGPLVASVAVAAQAQKAAS